METDAWSFQLLHGWRGLRDAIAVHVDDVRLVVDKNKEMKLKEELNKLFSFGEWKSPKEWTRFCGWFERQFENGVVQLQMNDYADRITEPPMRRSGNQETALMPNERKWVGTICGQLNWMARQCRGDLTFGVSRVQQLAGVNDPAALVELKILVDRAKEPVIVNFRKLHCALDKALVIGASDASFASMPRGRSQGGYVIMIANPEILEGGQRGDIPFRLVEESGEIVACGGDFSGGFDDG